MELAGTAFLVAATITTGWIAGLFYAFSCAVMLALRGASDRTFIDVMQRINRAILNGWFALGFVGAPVCMLLAALSWFVAEQRWTLVPLAAALVLYLGMVAVTSGINIPLNNELDAAGSGERLSDPTGTRQRFERRWVRWNNVRTVLTTAALGCLCWAWVLH